MMKIRRSNTWISVGSLTGVILLIMLLTTSPTDLPVLVLLVPPMLLFISLTSLLYGLLQVLRIQKRRRIQYAALISSVPVVLLLLQSIDQLTAKDVALMFVLALIGGFYMSKLRLKSNSKI